MYVLCMYVEQKTRIRTSTIKWSVGIGIGLVVTCARQLGGVCSGHQDTPLDYHKSLAVLS